MVEQGRPSPDIAFLHERGGLTPVHWEEVVKDRRNNQQWLRDNPFSGISNRVESYGKKVINCEFPDSGNHHRVYLGRRHWQYIAHLPTYDTQQRFLILPKTNRTIVQAAVYAQGETERSYTLDDYIFDHKLEYRYGEWRIDDNGIWEENHLETVWEPSENHWMDGTISYGTQAQNIDHFVVCGDQTFFTAWLLAEDELPPTSTRFNDPPFNDPSNRRYIYVWDAVRKLRQLATSNPDEFSQRLKARTPEFAHLHNSPHFGIVEKEVA